MAHQMNLFLHPHDYVCVQQIINDSSNVSILAGSSPTRKAVELPTIVLDESEMGAVDVTVYLVLQNSLNSVQLLECSPKKWTIDVTRSPVVEFTRCYMDDSLIRRGRLYAIRDYIAPDGSRISKPAIFTDWQTTLFRRLKSLLRWDPVLSAYCGRKAEEWRRQTHGRFVEM
mgnify:FL=1